MALREARIGIHESAGESGSNFPTPALLTPKLCDRSVFRYFDGFDGIHLDMS